jgi:predicted glycosyltransferase
VEAITFDTHVEELIANAAGVVSMGGYNTFCEILSLDKRALVLPRLRPRMEQYIRTSRAQNLGLLRMLDEQQAHDPLRMAQALRRLPEQPLPSEIVIPGLLDGLDNIHDMVGAWIANNRRVSLSAAARGA